jgi:uncharacterized protein YoxC
MDCEKCIINKLDTITTSLNEIENNFIKTNRLIENMQFTSRKDLKQFNKAVIQLGQSIQELGEHANLINNLYEKIEILQE